MASNKPSRKSSRGEEKLSLETVLELGGSKEDVAFLEGIDSDDEMEYRSDDNLDTDPINREELKNFIKQLGVAKYRPDAESAKSEKKSKKDKKAKQKAVADRKEDEQVTSSQSEEAKKKKKKNKLQIQDTEVSSTTRNLLDHVASYKPRKFLLVKAGESCLGTEMEKGADGQVETRVIRQLETFAATLMEHEVTLYNQQRERGRKAEAQFQRDLLGGKGTVENRISMLTLTVLHSPLHCLAHLDSLVAMARKKNARESMSAADKLCDLFIGHILPSERKLRTFDQHPFSQLRRTDLSRDVVDKKLVTWYYEAEMKKKYAAFLSALDDLSRNTLPAPRKKAINIMQKLILEKPEGENTLLPMLVNKLGDPQGATAACATHALFSLVRRHTEMKRVIVKEVEQYLFRGNTEKAKYNAVCFLNQLILSPEEKDVAVLLLNTYFAFFKSCVKKGEMDSRFMGALLSGVNRAYPFAKTELSLLDEQMNTLFKIVHVVNFSIGLQALLLLEKITESTCDRYYTALYWKMMEPALKSSSKQALFLHLVYRSMKKDTSEKRVQAFLKRLLQLCSYMTSTFVCGALLLLSEILKEKPHLLRIQQAVQNLDSDDEEHYSDVPDSDDETTDPQLNKMKRKTPASSWVHRANTGYKSDSTEYDMYHRNPMYARAEETLAWELQNLVHHHHPSVVIFATNILQGKPIEYTGDPLQDFTLIKFYDRFAYKNPKKLEEGRPMNKLARNKGGGQQGVKALAVNSKEFLMQGEENVPADEMFYYKYMTMKKLREGHDSDSEVSDSEFDAVLDAEERNLDVRGSQLHLDLDKDYFRGVGKSQDKTKRRKGAPESDSDDEDDEDLPSDLSDEDVGFHGDDDLTAEFKREMEAAADGADRETHDSEEDAFSDGFNEEDVEFSDEDFGPSAAKSKGRKRETPSPMEGPRKRKKLGDGAMFASAEEFSNLLEEAGDMSLGSLTAVVNKDNSGAKQLKWERDRDQQTRGGWRSKNYKGKLGKRKDGFAKHKSGKDRDSFGKHSFGNQKKNFGRPKGSKGQGGRKQHTTQQKGKKKR